MNPLELAAAENPYRAPEGIPTVVPSQRGFRQAAGILIFLGVPLAMMAAYVLAIDISYRLLSPEDGAFEGFSWRAELALLAVGACLIVSGVFLCRDRWLPALACGISAALFSFLAAWFIQCLL